MALSNAVSSSSTVSSSPAREIALWLKSAGNVKALAAKMPMSRVAMNCSFLCAGILLRSAVRKTLAGKPGSQFYTISLVLRSLEIGEHT